MLNAIFGLLCLITMFSAIKQKKIGWTVWFLVLVIINIAAAFKSFI